MLCKKRKEGFQQCFLTLGWCKSEQSLPSVFVLLQQYIQQWSDHGYVFPKLVRVHRFLFWLIPNIVLNWPITLTRLTVLLFFQFPEYWNMWWFLQYTVFDVSGTYRQNTLFLAVICWQLHYLLSRWLFITLSLTDKTLHSAILWCCQIDLFR